MIGDWNGWGGCDGVGGWREGGLILGLEVGYGVGGFGAAGWGFGGCGGD